MAATKRKVFLELEADGKSMGRLVFEVIFSLIFGSRQPENRKILSFS